jgi:hypothetical protein
MSCVGMKLKVISARCQRARCASNMIPLAYDLGSGCFYDTAI